MLALYSKLLPKLNDPCRETWCMSSSHQESLIYKFLPRFLTLDLENFFVEIPSFLHSDFLKGAFKNKFL